MTKAKCKPSRMPAGPNDAAVQAELAAAKRKLETLYAALDSVQSGLLLLDGNLQAVYSNPALDSNFATYNSDHIRNFHPSYVSLLEAVAANATVGIEDYIKRRLEWVRAADAAPMDLPMANGNVLRCYVTALPDGGRMLVYSDVTDIVRNAEAMERLATIDGMTGIYNRRHFLSLADRAWINARRHARPISLLMIDIDHFKSINDNFGHDVGDQVIVRLAHLASECKRVSDILARIGGEEFALLLPDTNLDGAYALADYLRRNVATNPLSDAPQAIRATVSIGVAESSEEMRSVSDLMKAADHALYQAKRGGRDQVICLGADNQPPRLQVGEAY